MAIHRQDGEEETTEHGEPAQYEGPDQRPVPEDLCLGSEARLPDQDRLTEAIFAAAQDITEGVAVVGLRKARFDLDRALDRLLTSRIFGFPIMLAVLAAVFWLTIEGANLPSSFLASVLVDRASSVVARPSSAP